MNRRMVLLTAIAPALWGTTYIVTTELLPPGRPLLAAALRALPAGVLLVAITRQLPQGSWWWRAAVLGTLNFAVFFALLFAAAYRLPGGVAATVGAIQPLVVMSLAVTVLGERAVPTKVAAGFVGLAGVGLLVLDGGARLDPIGVIAALGGAMSMATGTVLVQRWGRPVSALTFAGWQLTVGGVLLVPLALIVEGAPGSLTIANVAGFAYLATVGGALAYTLWFSGIERLGARNVTFLSLLSPMVATTIGVIAGDRLTAWQLAGAVAVVASIVAVQRPTRRAGTEGLVVQILRQCQGRSSLSGMAVSSATTISVSPMDPTELDSVVENGGIDHGAGSSDEFGERVGERHGTHHVSGWSAHS